MHVLGQGGLRRGVGYVVADVRDESLSRLNFGDEVKCLWQNEMRGVDALFAKCVDNEDF